LAPLRDILIVTIEPVLCRKNTGAPGGVECGR
jgi:hypothetical protein